MNELEFYSSCARKLLIKWYTVVGVETGAWGRVGVGWGIDLSDIGLDHAEVNFIN